MKKNIVLVAIVTVALTALGACSNDKNKGKPNGQADARTDAITGATDGPQTNDGPIGDPECLQAGCTAEARCTPAGCVCNDGYEGDGSTCTNVDECETNNGGCHADALCTDTPGSRTCACKPGFVGDGIQACADVVGELNGLRWDLPCTGGADAVSCACDATDEDMRVMGGVRGKIYNVTLRFRGVVEQKTYTGGTNDGALWQEGGSSADDPYNIYKLEITSPPQKYYLNRGTSYVTRSFPLDYTKVVQVEGGATVLLYAAAVDGHEIKNIDDTGTPIVMPAIPPAPAAFDGQFIQMDVLYVSEQ